MIATRHDEERGAVLVLMAILLVVLLGISALAVDLGIGRAHKREVQSGADAAALGGALELALARDLGDAESEARALEVANVADFEDRGWAGCTDSDALANSNGTSDCISFDTSFTHIRVLSPPQEISTLFGRIWSRDSLVTRAAAEARIGPVGFGTVLPFGLGSAFQLPEGCLKTQTGGQALPPCDGPATGNFGFLDVRQYGNATLQTPRRCGNGQNLDRVADNVAIGVDHLLGIYSGAELLDPGCAAAFPNTLEVRTGNIQSQFTTGTVGADIGSATIADRGGARLKRGQWAKESWLGNAIDDTPLYRFIPQQTLLDVPSSCQRSVFDTIVNAPFTGEQKRAAVHDQLQRCFFEYRCNRVDLDPTNLFDGSCTGPRGGAGPLVECGGNGCTGVLFSANTDPFGNEGDPDLWDIQTTPRFAYVPQFHEAVFGPGSSSNQHIQRFRAVYLYRLDARCTGGGCAAQFEPGPWNATGSGGGGGSNNLDALTAFVFEPTMLPGQLGDGPFIPGETLRIELVE